MELDCPTSRKNLLIWKKNQFEKTEALDDPDNKLWRLHRPENLDPFNFTEVKADEIHYYTGWALGELSWQ